MDFSNFSLEDLMTTCPRCQGIGRIGEMPASMGMRAALLDTCPDCESGQLYTPLGRTLREFVLAVQRVPR